MRRIFSGLHKRACIVALLSLLLGGCLVPDKYQATLSLSNHAYSFDYIGEMHMMTAYSREFAAKDPKELARKVVAEFERVIRERPQGVIETRLLSPKVFQTKFLYVSPYALPEASGLFRITVEGNILTVTSRPISAQERETLRLNAISSRGKLCIKAFGTVLASNAHRAATMLDRCNIWELDNLDEPVRLVVQFSHPIPLDGKKVQ